MLSLSILLPLFNEEKRLPKTLETLEGYMHTQTDFALELILINDGSSDATDALIRTFAEKHGSAIKVISYTKNRGRGYALRLAMSEAAGDWQVVLDADLAAPPSEIQKIVPCIERGCDVIVGSRTMSGAHIEIPPSTLRYVLGTGYRYLARLITGVRVSDYSCGFKGFSKKAAHLLALHTKIDRWAHDAENLYLAKKYGLKICEVPLNWHNGPETTVRVWRAVFLTLIELLRIPFVHR